MITELTDFTFIDPFPYGELLCGPPDEDMHRSLRDVLPNVTRLGTAQRDLDGGYDAPAPSPALDVLYLYESAAEILALFGGTSLYGSLDAKLFWNLELERLAEIPFVRDTAFSGLAGHLDAVFYHWSDFTSTFGLLLNPAVFSAFGSSWTLIDSYQVDYSGSSSGTSIDAWTRYVPDIVFSPSNWRVDGQPLPSLMELLFEAVRPYAVTKSASSEYYFGTRLGEEPEGGLGFPYITVGRPDDGDVPVAPKLFRTVGPMSLYSDLATMTCGTMYDVRNASGALHVKVSGSYRYSWTSDSWNVTRDYSDGDERCSSVKVTHDESYPVGNTDVYDYDPVVDRSYFSFMPFGSTFIGTGIVGWPEAGRIIFPSNANLDHHNPGNWPSRVKWSTSEYNVTHPWTECRKDVNGDGFMEITSWDYLMSSIGTGYSESSSEVTADPEPGDFVTVDLSSVVPEKAEILSAGVVVFASSATCTYAISSTRRPLDPVKDDWRWWMTCEGEVLHRVGVYFRIVEAEVDGETRTLKIRLPDASGIPLVRTGREVTLVTDGSEWDDTSSTVSNPETEESFSGSSEGRWIIGIGPLVIHVKPATEVGR